MGHNMKAIGISNHRSHQSIAWVFLIGLLFLRIPFLGGIRSFAQPQWLDPIFEIGTYLLTACLIWWERDRLIEFHIDLLALGIVLFKPVQTVILAGWGMNDNPLAFPNPAGLILWIIAIGLVLALRLSGTSLPRLSKSSWGWFGVGILAGLFTVVLMAYPMSLQIDKGLLLGLRHLLLQAPVSFIYQLGYAAVTEEPLFRAFLWVYLQKAGWKTIWVWLFQAGLFMLAHIYYITKYPISFWVIVPTSALVLGAVVWRSKTISSSLAAHATMNALGHAAGYILASLRL